MSDGLGVTITVGDGCRVGVATPCADVPMGTIAANSKPIASIAIKTYMMRGMVSLLFASYEFLFNVYVVVPEISFESHLNHRYRSVV